MPQREQIEELGRRVNTILTLYVEIHDGVIARPWWRSIPVPGLFKAIPFVRYEIQSLKLQHVLREIEDEVRTQYEEATPDERRFLAALHQYSIELLKTITALIRVVVRLRAKSEGKPYDYSAFNTDWAAYNIPRRGIMSLGKR
jgi:hypothetical protein